MIRNPVFITSAAREEDFIVSDKPVIVVCGKSNVGKSSFINMLAERKNLARTSSVPGKTRLINYFDFGGFILADLPGYGFAKVSKTEKEKWGALIEKFFEKKENIKHVFELIDGRHLPTTDDMTMIKYLDFSIIPFSIIATKCDKLSKNELAKSLKQISEHLKVGIGNITAVSSLTTMGRQTVVDSLKTLLGEWSCT